MKTSKKNREKIETLPNRQSEPTMVSIVIPCYNEEQRINFLINALKEFILEWKDDYEIIIVDDGSKDNTVSAIESNEFFNEQKERKKFSLIRLPQNKGKGAAVRAGILEAKGTHILTMDTDVSTHPLELVKWKKQGAFSENNRTVFIGSRPHEQSKLVENPMRKFVGYTFNSIVRLLTPLRMTDTQCGFKLYPADVAKYAFKDLKVDGWAHDVEVLYKIKLIDVSIKEMPIEWTVKEGSKVSVIADSVRMFFQILFIAIYVRFYWNIFLPVKAIFNREYITEIPASIEDSSLRRDAIFRFLFVAVSIFLLFLMPYFSKDYGISGDEKIQDDYGWQIYNYFFHDDPTALDSESGIHYYGGVFEFTAVAYSKLINSDDHFRTRHFLNALVGFLGILFTGFLAKQLGGWRAAFIALVFLAITPRFFGHSMNNPKDVPFAAAYVMSLYYMVLFLKQLPRPSLKTSILLAVGIALSINVRVGGALLIAYFGMFTALQLINLIGIRKIFTPEGLKPVFKVLPYVIAVVVLSYFGGLLFWPYGLSAPLTNPFIALSQFSNFFTNIRQVFEGQQLWSTELPWYYLPKYLVISNPVGILLGFVASISLLWFFRNRMNLFLYGVVFFTAIFPVAYILYQNSNVYNEWRHVLFIFPPIVVLSALGWEMLLRLTRNTKFIQYAVGVLLALFMLVPLHWMIKNHPHQYVYFNLAFGGVDNAHGYYETDYYMNSIKPAVEWLYENENLHALDDTVIIVTQGYFPAFYYVNQLGGKVKVHYTRYYERAQKDWDYAIFYSGYISPYQLQNNIWPIKGTFHTIDADNTPLSAIIKRENKDDFYGFQAIESGDYETAKQHFIKAVEYDPYNEMALTNLGLAYLNTNEPDKAVQVLAHAVNVYPGFFNTIYFLGVAYAQTGALDAAIIYLQQAIELNPGAKQAYQMLGNIYQQKGDTQTAQQYLEYAKRLP